MKRKLFIVLSIISTLIIIGWMISHFFGGMIIHLLMYGLIIIPFALIYIFTLVYTLIKLFRDGIKRNKIIFYTHTTGLFLIILFCFYQSELFKSRKILDATLHDDLSNINLVLRKNGKFETISNGIFGYTEKISGRYKNQNDTIIFLNKPYSNNFIPDTVIIDRIDNAIYFNKNSEGEFIREKDFLNYFEINLNEI